MDYSKAVTPLLNWYEENARPLPWRNSSDPYFIWISEIMLQQTRVEAVIPYFNHFVKELPDVQSLAEASEEKLLKLWQGLGYYSRVRNLQKAARMIMEKYGGVLPQEISELKELPGVGDYTAGAIASIAYGKPEPAVDGNVLRVAARITACEESVRDPLVKRLIRDGLKQIYPKKRAGDFTQALMELGATVCLPNGKPHCEACPLKGQCEGCRTGLAENLPVKAPKPAREQERKTIFVILSADGKVALRKRPEKGLLANLWEFPNVVGALPSGRAEHVLRKWGVTPLRLEPLPPARHVFTHVEWLMTGYLVFVKNHGKDFHWADQKEIESVYAIPSAFKSFLHFLREYWGYAKI